MNIEIDNQTIQFLITDNTYLRNENNVLHQQVSQLLDTKKQLEEIIETLKDLVKGNKENEYR